MYTEGRWPSENGGRNSNDIATSQGMPRIVDNYTIVVCFFVIELYELFVCFGN